MRQRLVMLWTPAILGLALMLPATTLAGATHTSVRQNYCDGYDPVLRVKATEHGRSGVTDFEFIAKVQRQSYSGTWRTIFTESFDSYGWFEDDGGDHSYAATYRYNSDGAHYYRVKILVKFWADQIGLVAKRTHTSVRC